MNDKNFLSVEQLCNKQDAVTEQILIPSFEYMLLKIAESYYSAMQFESIQQFNAENRVSYYKALVYSFFVAVSNGTSRSLYNLFGEFASMNFGPASVAIYQKIKERPHALKFFSIQSEINPLGVEIINGQNFDSIQRKIEEMSIVLNGRSVMFKDISVPTDGSGGYDHIGYKSLLSAIHDGVAILNTQSNHSFFLGDQNRILSHASFFKAFQRDYQANTSSVLEYSQIKDDKSRRFYSERMLAKA